MEYYLDTANVDLVEEAYYWCPLSGVTTNPSLMAKEGKSLTQVVATLNKIMPQGQIIHVQVLAQKAEQIVEEGLFLHTLAPERMVVKIPVTTEGLRAISLLKSKGIRTTATAVFTANQTLLAARAGADFVAPYVNRLDSICGDGCQVVADIANLFSKFNVKTKILSASFRTPEQVLKVALAGSHAVTVSYEVLQYLHQHPLTEESIKKFRNDWLTTFGRESFIP